LHFTKSSLIQYFVLLTLLISISTVQAEGDLSWAIPGESIYDDEVYVKILSEISPLDVKIYDGIAQTGVASLDVINSAYGVYEFRKSFVIREKDKNNSYADGLDRWYTIRFPNAYNVFDVLDAYLSCNDVDVAEISTIYRKIYDPNDEFTRSQWYLSKCELPAAWDVSKGSEDIVIGIVDDGMDMNAEGEESLIIHEDILANIWVNPDEDLNGDGIITIFDDYDGEDNDDNGYEDDFHGWNFGHNNYWPDDFHDDGHGTHVGGLASAVADNENGVAGAGFSCKLMIAACYDRNNPALIRYGYEGIVYCAQNGADVMNLSWGSDSGPNGRGREAIDFALEEGVIIFAGAGNDNVNDQVNRRTHFYPCAYDGVFGVGASNQSDNKANFSNYGDFIDIVAPGVSMLSTYPRNDYANLQGTSMSSPFAAGIAALMLSVRPNLSGEELLERMQQTSVDISGEDGPPGIRYRVNAGDLLNSTHPEFELIEWSIHEDEGNGNGRAEPGENISISFEINNRQGFEDAHGITLHLETEDATLNITRSDIQLGDLAGGDALEVDRESGFTFSVRGSRPHYSTFNLTISSEEGWDSEFELDLIIGQPLFLLVDDDDGGEIQAYYQADLDENTYVYDSWNIEQDWFPSQEYLDSFRYIIWETGDSRNSLGDDEQAMIQNYLEADGNILLIGQYIGDDHGDTEFFSDILHARHIEDDLSVPQIEGVDGHPLSDGINFLLLGGSGAGNNDSPSSCEPIDGAEVLFNYTAAEGAAGTYFWNETYQVIYLGFALEAAAGAGSTTSRAEFIDLALKRFVEVGVKDDDAEFSLPTKFFISQAYPNPFNSSTVMQVLVPSRDNVLLEAIDINGRRVDMLHNGWLNPGVHNFSWDAKGQTAGVYFMRVNWQGGTQSRRVVLLK